MNQTTGSINAAAFREAMRLFPAAVSIVATQKDGVRHGHTASAVCSLSAEPARILTCADKTNGNDQLIIEAERFSVNLLSEDQGDLASRFAGKPVETRFDHGDWRVDDGGAPLLVGAVLALDCVLEQHTEFETHSVLFGRIVACHIEDKPALMYRDRQYGGFRAGNT